MSFSERGVGYFIIGLLSAIIAISRCNDKYSSDPKVSQPYTGHVSDPCRYEPTCRPAIPTVEEKVKRGQAAPSFECT
jgi:hypothetical protein